MKIQTWAVGILLLTGTCVWAEKMKLRGPAEDGRAAVLMQEAARSRYTWGADVIAVAGKFTWSKDGKGGSGSFRSVLHQRDGLTFAAEDSTEVPAEVREHIASLIMHRTPPTADSAPQVPGSYAILLEDDDRGPLILTASDLMLSSQRVKDGKFVQVNRTMGGRRFTIDVTRFEKSTDGRFCPADITVTLWDAATGKRLEKRIATTDGFFVQEGQLFPKAEKIISEKAGKTSELDIRYSEVKFETGGHRAARD
jgi:hypothetical protein